MPEEAAAATVRETPQIERFEMLHISDIVPSPLNRRCGDDDPGTQVLAESLQRDGLLQAIVVRPLGDAYEIVCGERRWRAARRLGWREIRCGVIDCDERTATILRFAENVERQDLSPMEEGEGVAAMLEQFGGDVSEVAARLKWKEPWVRRRARLVDLSPMWCAAIAAPDGEYDHIRDSVERLEELAVLPQETQDALLRAGELLYKRTTPELRRTIALWMRRLDAKPWTREWEKKAYSGSTGARCDACRKRSGSKDGGLFDTIVEAAATEAKDKSDLCLDPKCWEEKTERFLKAQIEDYPFIHLLADGYPGHDVMVKLAEKYGQKTLPGWSYECCRPGIAASEGFTIEAKGLYIHGNRIGKVVDIMLRDDSADEAEDADRSSELREARERAAKEQARLEAMRNRLQEMLPHTWNDLRDRLLFDAGTILMNWCAWFGLTAFRHDHEDEAFDAGARSEQGFVVAWAEIREEIVHFLFKEATGTTREGPAAAISEQLRSQFSIDLDAIRNAADQVGGDADADVADAE